MTSLNLEAIRARCTIYGDTVRPNTAVAFMRDLLAAVDRVRKIHEEYEGRCLQCVEWCECPVLDDCTHGNVEWPCPTIRALDGDS